MYGYIMDLVNDNILQDLMIYSYWRGKEVESNKIVLPVLGAVFAAIIGGAIWLAIAITTEYELGIIAWVIAGIAGYLVSVLAKRQTTVVHQVIAVIASLLGILLGKYFIYGYFVGYESISGIFSNEALSTFPEFLSTNFMDVFSGMDIVFVALAVITAWQLPAKLAQNTPPTEQTTEAQ